VEIIANATAISYQGASQDIQQKLRKMVEVWNKREVFTQPTLKDIESKLDGMSQRRSWKKSPLIVVQMWTGTEDQAKKLH
jgi:hypothetical protein